MKGYFGAYLRIDVSDGSAQRVPVSDDVLARYLGGVGLGTWICLQEGGATADPLAPEAPLVFALSPLVGTPLTTSAKFAVVARSPLTGFLSDAISSSHFAIAAKRAGVDAIVLVGKADRPVRVVVDDDSVGLEEPGPEVEKPRFRTAYIGLAGRNLVRYATITNDGRHAGRGGLGAVMGAKNVVALSVRGTRKVEVHDPRGVVAAARDLSERSFGPATAKYRELGTIANVLAFNRLDTLPTRNFREGRFEGAPAISAEALHKMANVGRASCAACTIGCEHIFAPAGGTPVRLEYETLFALGSLLGIDDRDTVLKAAALCDEHGLDTISTGGTLACWMEAGRLGFGDGDAVLDLIGTIARREDEGDLLAEGARRVAESLGRPELAMHVKGLEIPGYDPRRLPAMALGFAVGTRGADHNRSGAYELDFSEEDFDVRAVVAIEDRTASMDSLILCKFLRGVFDDYPAECGELYRLVTGVPTDLMEAGERVCALRKHFNVKAGWTREDDGLPARLSPQNLTDMIEQYYEARCWTREGLIPPETAERLRLLSP